MRENFFIILELKFDPPVNDETVISKTIKDKCAEWTKSVAMGSGKAKQKAEQYLSMKAEIEKIMLDPAARSKEAADAMTQKKEALQALREKIRMLLSTVDTIKPNVIKSLVLNNKKFGITEEEIRAMIQPAPEKKLEPGKLEIISNEQIKKIRINLDVFGESNLYGFLKKKDTASPDELCRAGEELRKKFASDATGGLKVKPGLELAGLCSVIFKDKKSKEKYDNYLKLTRYKKTAEKIDEIASNHPSGKRMISAKGYQYLLNECVSEGKISVNDAVQYIHQYCATFEIELEESEKIVCPNCNTENPSSADTCSKCGKPLKITCPKCGKKCAASTELCPTCNLSLKDMPKALPIIKRAQELLALKKTTEVIECIRQASEFWPNHPDIAVIEEKVAELKKQREDAFNSLQRDIDNKAFYSALVTITKLKNDGFNIDDSIEQKVKATIGNVEKLIQQSKSASDRDAAFELLYAASQEISDSKELNTLLVKYPPIEPKSISCKVQNDAIFIEWEKSPSKGRIVYSLIRKNNSAISAINDGEIVFSGEVCSFIDTSVKVGQVYFYAVVADRVGIKSNVVASREHSIILPPLSGIRVVPDDGSISVSWDIQNTLSEIKVWKKTGGEEPKSIDECELVPSARIDGYSESSLQNGYQYWYLLRAVHTINGVRYNAHDIVISAVPQRPPEPLNNFTVKNDGEKFVANWEATSGDVVFFSSKKKIDFSSGEACDITELLGKYQRVEILSKNSNSAILNLNFSGSLYVFPAVVNSSVAILSKPVCITNILPVSDTSADINAGGSEMYVNFKWPKNVKKVLLLYRFDKYPESSEDPIAVKIPCSKEKYEYDDAILIKNPENKTYYCCVYSEFVEDGTTLHSEGVSFKFDNQPQRDITYKITYSKPLFSGKPKLQLTIKSDQKVDLPKFLIVCKSGALPLNKGDGEILASVSESTEFIGTKTFSFDVSSLPRNATVRMFFVDERMYKKFKLTASGPNKLN